MGYYGPWLDLNLTYWSQGYADQKTYRSFESVFGADSTEPSPGAPGFDGEGRYLRYYQSSELTSAMLNTAYDRALACDNAAYGNEYSRGLTQSFGVSGGLYYDQSNYPNYVPYAATWFRFWTRLQAFNGMEGARQLFWSALPSQLPPGAQSYEVEGPGPTQEAEWTGRARLNINCMSFGAYGFPNLGQNDPGPPRDISQCRYELRVSSAYTPESMATATTYDISGTTIATAYPAPYGPDLGKAEDGGDILDTTRFWSSQIPWIGQWAVRRPYQQLDITNYVNPSTGSIVLVPVTIRTGSLDPTYKKYDDYGSYGLSGVQWEPWVEWECKVPRIRYYYPDTPPPATRYGVMNVKVDGDPELGTPDRWIRAGIRRGS